MVGMSRGRPEGRVIKYSCANGMSGTLTPAISPISGANMPPALTTRSVVMSPASVMTPRTRPSLMSIPVTRVASQISAPRRRAPSMSANVSWLGSM